MRKSLVRFAVHVFFVAQYLVSYGQTDSLANTASMRTMTADDSTKIKLDSLESKISSLQKTLNEVKKIVANDTITSYSVGTFTLFATDNLIIYHYVTDSDKKKIKTATSDKVNITKVIVDISGGVISDIQVLTKENKTFTNGSAPIEVNRFNERCDLLKFFNGNELVYLQTCDFMNWVRSGNYTPNDARFELVKKDDSKSLAKDVGVNSIFNIKLYSDMLSAFGNESNGLVQTEANFKTPLISSNIKNKPFFLLHYFTANFRLSKFDDKYKYSSVLVDNSDTIYTSSDTTFSRQTLNQRNWLNIDVGFNILSGQFGNKSKSGYAVDILGGFALSNFASFKDSMTVGLPYWGFNPSIKIVPAPNLGLNLSCPLIWQYAPQLKDKGYGQEKKIISPEIEMYWNPMSSPGNKIFARARYVTMVGDNNPFWQVQVGYNLALSEIINKELENK